MNVFESLAQRSDFLKSFGLRSQKPEPVFQPIAASSRTTAEKIDFHIRRFRIALAQCEKGDSRKAELQANLDYWEGLKRLETKRSGVSE